MTVEEFTIQTLLGLPCRLSVRILDPNVALVVLFNENSFNNSINLSLFLDFSFEVFKISRRSSLHFEHICHNQVRSCHSWDRRSVQISVTWSSCSLKFVHKISLTTSTIKILITSWYFTLLLDSHNLNWDFLVSNYKAIHLLHCSFSFLWIDVLDKSKTFTNTSLRVSVNINVLDFSERFEELFQIFLGYLWKFVD
jgi:hypothetical protein